MNKVLGEFGNTLIEEAVFSFIDVETTGLSPSFGDRICEIAILKRRGKKIIDSFHTLVNPERQISQGAQAVNNITDEMVKNAPCFRDIAQNVINFIEDSIIVAHNAPFDLLMIKKEGIVPKNFICTLRLARYLAIAKRYYHFPSNSLENLARCFGIRALNLHRSMADAEVTKKIFDIFVDDFSKKGVETIEQLFIKREKL